MTSSQEFLNALCHAYEAALDRGDKTTADKLHKQIAKLVTPNAA